MKIKKVGVLGCGVMGGQIAAHLTTMAMTYMSGQQTAPPIVPPSHTADLMSLFQEFPPDQSEVSVFQLSDLVWKLLCQYFLHEHNYL